MQKKLPADPFLKKALRISLILHGSLVVVVLLQSAVSTLFNSSSKEEAAALKKSQMAKQAIRVDMVDLPRYKLEDLKNIDLTEEVGEEEIKTSESEKESGPSENAMKFKNEEAAREAKAREELQKKAELESRGKDKRALEEKNRLEELRSRLRADSKRQEIVGKLKGGREVLAGNKLSKGYSQTGDIASDADEYAGKLRAHVHKNWGVPGWMRAGQLKAVMLVKIGPDGSVIEKEFTKKSGNGPFDSTIEAAIERADPFPAPPKALARMYMEEGFECGFPN